MTDKSKLSWDEYLRGLALFVCANDHYVRSRQFEAQMAKVLGIEGEGFYCGFVSDAIYSDDFVTASDFDAALRKSEIEVEPAAPPPNGEQR
jgi:hypothetical protein